jgi:DNA-binding NarL/FixJ family response regulator
MPECNGVVLARRIAEECQTVRVLALTFYEDRAYVRQLIENGARGYLVKRSAAGNLIPAIRAVLAGGSTSIRSSPIVCFFRVPVAPGCHGKHPSSI